MVFAEICQSLFNWNPEQFEAFREICKLMGCGPSLEKLINKSYQNSYTALAELNSILQDYLFRNGKHNPFGLVQDRLKIESSLTKFHQDLAKQLLRLQINKAQPPSKQLTLDAILILGSTVQDMYRRIEFCRDYLLPAIIKPEPLIYGLSGERILMPNANQELNRAYLGDIIDNTLANYHFKYHIDHQPTEAGAMDILLNNLMPGYKTIIINARAKIGHSRPDTEETAYWAGLELVKIHHSFNNLKLAIVTESAFQGQKDQVACGLIRAGLKIDISQIELYGPGYPNELVENSAALIQILVSSIAEHAYSMLKRLKIETNRV
jgi:hypothetical protein